MSAGEDEDCAERAKGYSRLQMSRVPESAIPWTEVKLFFRIERRIKAISCLCMSRKSLLPELPFDPRFLIILGVIISLFGLVLGSGYPGVSVEDRWVRTHDGKSISVRVFIPVKRAQGNPGVLLIHGFAGTKKDVELKAYQLALRGIVAVTMDMRGHGISDGPFTFGLMEPADAAQVIDWMITTYNLNESDIGVYGHSMGGLVALNLATFYFEPKAMVVLHSPWNLSALDAWQAFKLFLGENFVSQFQCSSPCKFLNSSWDIPLLLMQGLEDETVPPGDADKIYNAIDGESKEWVQLIKLEGFGHADLERASISTKYTVFWFEVFLLGNRSLSDMSSAVDTIKIQDYVHYDFFYSVLLSGVAITFFGFIYSFPAYTGTNPTPPKSKTLYTFPVCLFIGAKIGQIVDNLLAGILGGLIMALIFPYWDMIKQLKEKPKGFNRPVKTADLFISGIIASMFMVLVGLRVLIPLFAREAVSFGAGGFLVYTLMVYPLGLYIEIIRTQDTFNIKQSIIRAIKVSLFIVLSIMVSLLVVPELIIIASRHLSYVLPPLLGAIVGFVILMVVIDTIAIRIQSMYARALLIAMAIGFVLTTRVNIFA